MSRERLFWWEWFIVAMLVLAIAAFCVAIAGVISLQRALTTNGAEDATQTRNDLAPVFRCIGAGGQVVVSRGGDGSSIYIFCDEIKS